MCVEHPSSTANQAQPRDLNENQIIFLVPLGTSVKEAMTNTAIFGGFSAFQSLDIEKSIMIGQKTFLVSYDIPIQSSPARAKKFNKMCASGNDSIKKLAIQSELKILLAGNHDPHLGNNYLPWGHASAAKSN